MRISDWSSDVCSSDLPMLRELGAPYHLIGYCLGGTMSVASAVLSPPLSLTLIATPWDFDGFSDDQRETLQSLWESAQPPVDALGRSEERRGGKECVSTCRYRWSPYHKQKNTNNYQQRTK